MKPLGKINKSKKYGLDIKIIWLLIMKILILIRRWREHSNVYRKLQDIKLPKVNGLNISWKRFNGLKSRISLNMN